MRIVGTEASAHSQAIAERQCRYLRVLHVIAGLDARAGGTTAAVLGLAIAQVRSGMMVTVMATFRLGHDSTAVDTLRAAGVEVTLVGPVWGPLGWAPRTRLTVQRMVNAAEIIHIHGLWADIQHQAAVESRNSGRPYVVTPHGMLDPWSLAQSRWKKYAYMRWRLLKNLNCAAALHYTAPIEKKLCDRLSLAPPKVIEPNGIDLREFRKLPPRGHFRDRYRIESDAPMVLFLGRLHPKKGCDILINAFARVIAEQEGVLSQRPCLVIAGPDSNNYQKSLEALVSKWGVTEAIRFVGPLYRQEKLSALADADLFALVSHQENFGIAVIEALAAGCPVLLSDQVNIYGLVETEQLGWVVPTEIDATAHALSSWLSSGEKLEETRVRAQAVAKRFDWQEIAVSWIEHYQRIIGGHTSIPTPRL